MSAMKPHHFMNYIRQCKGYEKVLSKVNIVSMENGKGLAEFKVEEEHTNIIGKLHGGFSAMLVDAISSFGLATHKNGGNVHVSVDMHLTYFKAASLGDEIQILTDTLKAGKTLAFLEVLIQNKQTGELLVKGLHTKYILDVKINSKE